MKKLPEHLKKKAVKAYRSRDLITAARLFRRGLELDPSDRFCKINLAVVLHEQGNHREQYQLARELYSEDPDDPAILNQIGLGEYTNGLLAEGYEKLKRAAQLDPNRFDTFLNLSAIAGEIQDFEGGLRYAFEAVRIRPDAAFAHNNLGSAFMSLGHWGQAEECFLTVITLDPLNVHANINLAVCRSGREDPHEVIKLYAKCLTLPEIVDADVRKVRFFMGMCYLEVGDFAKGWANYAAGFYPGVTNLRNPPRKFVVPKWDGSPLRDKRLLVWREQGLGDELFFGSVLKDLEKLAGKVILECEPRLVATFKRSFPNFTVRHQAYFAAPDFGAAHEDFDLHIPLGDLMGVFRRSLADFESSGPYIAADNEKVALFDGRLGPRGSALRVGICWRSGMLSANRNLGYSALSTWEALLRRPNTQVINLQYGAEDKELSRAEQEFGISINSWPDVDLRNDLDTTFSLIKSLDVVVSVGTAVAQMAAAAGVRTILLVPKLSWTSFGTTQYPAYSNVQILTARSGEEVSTLIPEVLRVLSSHSD